MGAANLLDADHPAESTLDGSVTLDHCVVDLALQRVLTAEEAVPMTTKEVEVLAYLAARPNAVVSRDELLREVWGFKRPPRTRAVDIVVARLRQKIEVDPAEPRHVLTVTGSGYRFVPPRADLIARPLVTRSGDPGPVWIACCTAELNGEALRLAERLGAAGLPALVDLGGGSAALGATASVIVWLLPGGPVPERVTEHLRITAARRLTEGRPVVLPVRLPGGEPVAWSDWGPTCPCVLPPDIDPGDLSRFIQELRDRPRPPWSLPRLSRAPTPLARPAVQPAGAAYTRAWCAPWPALDAEAALSLGSPGAPVVIQGPASSGKTWLLRRLVEGRPEGVRAVTVEARGLGRATLGDPVALLERLALEILDQAELDGEPLSLGGSAQGPRRALDRWLEGVVLPACPAGLWLALDDADLLRAPGRDDEALTMLRAWASRARPPWDRLRLLLSISTEPALLMDRPELSPFNLSPPLRLGDLDPGAVAHLAALYGVALSASDAATLRAAVGGQPYLVRLALHALSGGYTMDEIVAQAADGLGPWGDHLRARLLALQAAPALAEITRRLLADPAARLDHPLAHRLVSAGLLVPQGAGYRFRYAIYPALLARAL